MFSSLLFYDGGNTHQRLVNGKLLFTYRKGQKYNPTVSDLRFWLLTHEIFKLGLGCHEVSFLREWEKI